MCYCLSVTESLIRDDRISKLITWYVKALQKAMDLIWDFIEGRLEQIDRRYIQIDEKF